MSDQWGGDDRLDDRDGFDEHEDWYEVSRRYRRGLGGWWWAALVLIPLLLALIGSFLFGGKDDEPTGDESSKSSASGSGESSGSSSDAAAAADAVSYRGGADEVDFAASAPSEADREALVGAVKDANVGRAVNAEVKVDESAPLLEGAALGGLTSALQAGGEGLRIDGDASELTLTGEIADEAARKKVLAGLGKAYPDAKIVDDALKIAAGGRGGEGSKGAEEAKGDGASSKASPTSSTEESGSTSGKGDGSDESGKGSEGSAEPTSGGSGSSGSGTEEKGSGGSSSTGGGGEGSGSTDGASESGQGKGSDSSPSPSSTEASEPAVAAVSKVEDLTCENASASMDRILAANPVTFPSGSDALYGDSAVNVYRVGSVLADCDVTVTVVGHTDNRSDDQLNERVSEMRAEKVAQALVVAGVEFGDITKKSAGSSQPVASNDSEDGRAKNRRVSLQVN